MIKKVMTGKITNAEEMTERLFLCYMLNISLKEKTSELFISKHSFILSEK